VSKRERKRVSMSDVTQNSKSITCFVIPLSFLMKRLVGKLTRNCEIKDIEELVLKA
jgi:hypothetical protein